MKEEEDSPEVKSRRAKVERSTSRNESLGEDSRRRRSQMRKKMWEEMEGKDSGVVGDDEGVSKDDIRDTMTHVTDDLKHEDVQGNYLTYSKSYLQAGRLVIRKVLKTRIWGVPPAGGPLL